MEINTIASKDNKLVKEYVKLLNDKAYRKSTNQFVIESQKLVNEALISNINIIAIFVSKDFSAKNMDFLNKFNNTNTRTYHIVDAIENKIKSTTSVQGIYAICEQNSNVLTLDTINSGGKYLLLSDMQDTGNCGTIIRTAVALGMDGIIVSQNNCDIYNIKVLRGAMGAIFKTSFLITDELEFLTSLPKEVATLSAVLDENAVKIEDVTLGKTTILIIGNEGNGIKPEVLDLSKQKVIIKMLNNTESLNASVAAGILMWEIIKMGE